MVESTEIHFLQKPTLTTYKPIPVAKLPDGKVGLTITLFSVPKFHTSVSRGLNDDMSHPFSRYTESYYFLLYRI